MRMPASENRVEKLKVLWYINYVNILYSKALGDFATFTVINLQNRHIKVARINCVAMLSRCSRIKINDHTNTIICWLNKAST